MSNTFSFSAPFTSDKDFSELLTVGEAMANASGTDKNAPKFQADPSFISLDSKPAMAGTGTLAVDVGGTHIKVGLRLVSPSGQVSWKELMDVDNNSLNTRFSHGKCLEQMAFELSRQIVAKLERAALKPADVTAVGVVWSNQLCSQSMDASKTGTNGVTGVVTGSQEGKAYRKGEWWNRDIADGDNLGEIFIQAFKENGFAPRAFVIGNDTIFSCKAMDNADSGMVASTGANTTIVPVGAHMLCNSESGGNFDIAREVLSLPKDNSNTYIKLEDVLTGKGMPVLFADYVIRAAEGGVSELTRLAQTIAKTKAEGRLSYSGQDLSFIASGKFREFLHGRDANCYNDETLNSLRKIAQSVIVNGGRFAAAMAYFSIFNQINEKDTFVIALDSSQARFQPGYLDTMRTTLDSILKPKKKKAEICLLEPEGEISVPMIGVARAANDFL